MNDLETIIFHFFEVVIAKDALHFKLIWVSQDNLVLMVQMVLRNRRIQCEKGGCTIFIKVKPQHRGYVTL